MAATSISQKERYQLQWNDGSPIDIPADFISNSTTLSNMFIDVDKEEIIQCHSENIKEDDVKLYFQHYHSLLAKQETIDPIKLLDFLLLANYFDDSAMMPIISRRIINSVHNILWKKTMKKDELKKLGEKFRLLPPEIRHVILDDLEKYAAIKGPYRVARYVSLPYDDQHTIKDILITDRGKIMAAIQAPDYSTSVLSDTCIQYLVRDMLITNQGKVIAALEISQNPVPTEFDTSSMFCVVSQPKTVHQIEAYDEQNPERAMALNELSMGLSYKHILATSWRYNCLGGLAADGAIWGVTSRKFLNTGHSENRIFSASPKWQINCHFYLPNDSYIERTILDTRLMPHGRIAMIPSSTIRIENIIDLSTNCEISSVPSDLSHLNCDPTGQYMIGLVRRSNGTLIKFYQIAKAKPIFQSMINFSLKAVTKIGTLIKIDPYRRLIYIVMCGKFKKVLAESTPAPPTQIPLAMYLPTLIVLNFSGEMVARYLLQYHLSVHFTVDRLVTIEHNKRGMTSINSLEGITDHLPEITDYSYPLIQMTPFRLLPSVPVSAQKYLVVERDVNDDWRPLTILNKMSSLQNIWRPRIIFSPNGHYLLLANSAGEKDEKSDTLTVMHTRLHPAEEITMIRKTLLGPANTEVGSCKASTSSAP